MNSFPKESGSPKTLVIGLGNPILGDDGIGWRTAEAIKRGLSHERLVYQDIEVACYALGGLSLMERLIGYDLAIIIDAVQTSAGIPGQVYDLRMADLPDFSVGHMTAAHDTSLQTALKLGQTMGATLPTEIRVVGIEAEKVYEFSEELSPAVEAAIPEATQLVLNQLNKFQGQRGALVTADRPVGS